MNKIRVFQLQSNDKSVVVKGGHGGVTVNLQYKPKYDHNDGSP